MLVILCTVVSALKFIVVDIMKFSDNNVSLQTKELISASKSGDVMTVVSLLNSGADILINYKVYNYTR